MRRTRSFSDAIERIPGLAAELIQRRVDVMVVSSSPAVGPVMKATSTIPIVFLTVGDPVGSGFVSNLARPGGNVTGLGGLGGLGYGLVGKSLDLLKQAVPRAQRIGVLMHPDFAMRNAVRPDVAAGAQRLGMQLRWVHRTSAADAQAVPGTDARRRADVLWPASYGRRIEDEVRRLPYYLDRILKGTPPGDLPVEQPTRFYLVLNRKTANALGLTLPQSLLLQATEVVE